MLEDSSLTHYGQKKPNDRGAVMPQWMKNQRSRV